MKTILVINAGSSSLKFQLFDVEGGTPRRRIRGQLDGIGVHPRLRATDGAGATLVDREQSPGAILDLPTAIEATRAWFQTLEGVAIDAIGHRVVHGGPDFDRPVLIDAEVLDHLARLVPLAPLHQPNNLAPIRLVMETAPGVPQVACFDTAFHRHRAAFADCYALPRALYDKGIRRYGFHGLSYEYIAARLPEVAPDVAGGRPARTRW